MDRYILRIMLLTLLFTLCSAGKRMILIYHTETYVTLNNETNIYFIKIICIYNIQNYKLLYFGLFWDLFPSQARYQLSRIAQLVASLRRYLMGLYSYIPEQPKNLF